MLQQRFDRELRLIRKAQADPAFRAALCGADARQAIAASAGVAFPASLQVRVVQEQPGEMVFVLPQMRTETVLIGELSDNDLESVAGGKGDTTEYKCDPSYQTTVQDTRGR